MMSNMGVEDDSNKSNPPDTWARLKPISNNNVYIFLTRQFNCLGKFPDSTPTHHQLPVDPQISDIHCEIRIENFTGFDNKSKQRIIFEDISDSGTWVNGKLIKRGENPSVIEIKNGATIEFPGHNNYEFEIVNKLMTGNFDQKYIIVEQLGEGNFSTVHLAIRKHDRQQFAVKKLDKAIKLKDMAAQNKLIRSEIQILNTLGHENLIEITDFYDEPKAIYLVIEYVEDGDFSQFLKERQNTMEEKEIRIIFKQLFAAIKYLHNRSIVHRDLKPANILMPSKKGLRIKVSDFGLSKLASVNSAMETRCGSIPYAAPEVIKSSKGSYSKSVDLWSIGVILYYCLSGKLPFVEKGDTRKDIITKMSSGEYTLDTPLWSNVSPLAKQLVRSLLTKDPNKRISAEEALVHPFMREESTTLKLDETSTSFTSLSFTSSYSDESYHTN